MTIPDFQTIMLPLLKHISDGKIHTVRILKDTLADYLELSDEERHKLLPSGQQTVFHNRVAWAKTYMERAGLLETVTRGQFTITDRGREVLNSSVDRIDQSFLLQFDEFRDFKSRDKNDDETTVEKKTEIETPEEALQTAYKQIREDLAADLIYQVKRMTPVFFEKLVLDLMLAMGYGGSQDTAGSLTVAGADEGIDGVINEDQLGLDIVYLQAKRWENQVGRPEIQKFVGALHGKRARKGVFLTTSTFSRDAHQYVETIDPKVVLIDGNRLAQLMIDFNVGVSTAQSYFIKRIDSDYFIED
ncbi:restriction endonuclease [Gimesia benthica]|uniref:Restriction endonuclease n=1 Tax=Gimesia benthica TaxID=2608982 RepID=A0A6I6AA29_9PLAN|nr:restriction endonuclease [Gimesia benthica]QGQ21939.1 restriction endonuclease [Gimesia benthica]